MPRRTAKTADTMAKGPTTRARIVDDAIRLASVEGLSGITIGRLAERTGMSKSGLFAHFASREAVEVSVLEEAITRFRNEVVLPALKEPRGEPRVRALVDAWYKWGRDEVAMPGGCVLMQASVELDDQPGPARDLIADAMRQWHETLKRAAAVAVDEGHFRDDLDATLFAYQIFGTMLAAHQYERLLEVPGTPARMRKAIDALIDAARPLRKK